MNRLRNFGFLLKDVSHRYVLRFEQRARGISLTLPQCKALVRLENNEGVSQAKLAELADVEQMTMVRILDRMEADGLIERRSDPADRRARRLYLTGKGRTLLDKIWRLAELTRAETFSGINREDREAFMGLLERMHRNVCALEDRPITSPETVADMQTKPASAKGSGRSRKTQRRK
ncbi:MAG TPA: MarR family transcriptional regulator [Nitrospiria bacterium]|jgi:DNA-binding MarR family transcriptional regulator|nr:MarR family transcriptional regulator [Nitrospiria bacterium]